MLKFKYEIGEKLYLAGCSESYKKANPFIVGKRKIEAYRIQIEGGMHNYVKCMYSPDADEHCQSWYGEGLLTKSIKTGE
tara:strand:+ start:356 stop:592 length:237 start_codon:yes stop_codon:yes gene_type:complete